MQFWYPPRPEKAILPSMIRFYEQRGFVAQIKKKWNVFDRQRGRPRKRDVFHTTWRGSQGLDANRGSQGLVWPVSRLILRFRAIALERGWRPRHDLSLRRAENERNGSGRLPLKRASMPLKHVAGKRKDIRGTDLHKGFDGALSWSVGPARRRRRAERPGSRPSRMSPRRAQC